jgi:hypothetical protein
MFEFRLSVIEDTLGGHAAWLMSDYDHALLTHRVITAVVLCGKTHAKAGGHMDPLFDDHPPKLGASANKGTRHQN